MKKPTVPAHVPGTMKGEEMVLDKGREPGRGRSRKSYRTARDSTGIRARNMGPIDRRMIPIPPA